MTNMCYPFSPAVNWRGVERQADAPVVYRVGVSSGGRWRRVISAVAAAVLVFASLAGGDQPLAVGFDESFNLAQDQRLAELT
jgi:hypothetical protein